MDEKEKKKLGFNSLYITYDGALDPLGQSQIIPYLAGLASLGVRFSLLSFEKPDALKNKKGRHDLADYFKKMEINWVYIRYHKNPTFLVMVLDIIIGFLTAFRIAIKQKINIVHARSYMPAFIAFLLKKTTGTNYIFDMRGFWADERIDGNLWRRDSLRYKLVKMLEKTLLINSKRITVLTMSAKNIIENFDFMKNKNIPVDIIPTCVDLKRFYLQKKNIKILNRLGINDRFILFYLGSVGTWYMLGEMIDFFGVLKNIKKNSFFLFLANSGKDLIETEMEKRGISRNDFHIEHVLHSDVPAWLSVADASIFFIRPSFSKKATYPTKLGESLACGIPMIINSQIGDIDEFVKTNKVGVVINRFCPDSYRKGIGELLELVKNDGDSLRFRCRKAAETKLSLEDGVAAYLNKCYKKY